MSGKILTVTLNPCLDRTVSVERFVPSGLNRAVSSRTDPGGKGINVARVLKSFDADVTAVGFLAGKNGSQLREAVERLGICTAFTETPGETRTNLKLLDLSSGRITEVNERGCPVPEECFIRFRESFASLVRDAEYVVLSGSIPPGLSADVYRDLAETARKAGARVVLDADGEAFREGLKAIPFAVKPNRAELEAFCGCALPNEAALVEAARDLLREGVSLAVVSLDAQGAFAVANGEVWKAVPPKIAGGSATGAGDSMVAALVLALRRGDTLPELLRSASAAGTATAAKPGTQLCTPEETTALLPEIQIEPWNG